MTQNWLNFRFILLATASLTLVACSGDDEQAQIDGPGSGSAQRRAAYVETPVEDLYNRALDELTGGIYRNAAAMFDEVERQHPYSVWARRAMLMSAYSQYLDGSYDLAILSSERFLALHPGNSNAPYANYLIAICYYEQISDVGRDQKMTELALARLTEVARRYPATQYARDARLKIDLTRDHLAGKEMNIGRYYMDRGEYVAAINRFRNVVTIYETTTHVPEALHRLVESYLTVGLTAEAQTVAAVLGHNYPNVDWYDDSYRLLQGVDLQPQMLNDEWSKQLRANAATGSAPTGDASAAGRDALLGKGDATQQAEQPNFDDEDVPAAAPVAPIEAAPVPTNRFRDLFRSSSTPQGEDDKAEGNDEPAARDKVEPIAAPPIRTKPRTGDDIEDFKGRLRTPNSRNTTNQPAPTLEQESGADEDEDESSFWQSIWPF